jgi:hypothetical protein
MDKVSVYTTDKTYAIHNVLRSYQLTHMTCYFHVMQSMVKGLAAKDMQTVTSDMQTLHYCTTPMLFNSLSQLVLAKWSISGLKHIADHLTSGYLNNIWRNWYVGSIHMEGKGNQT